jgi:hypothetical protein
MWFIQEKYESPVIGWEIAGNRNSRGVEEKGLKWK